MTTYPFAPRRGTRPHRFALAAFIACVVWFAPPTARPALAQPAFPSRPVTLVVPFPPGGVVDVIARILQPRLTERLGQPILVDNRPGASGQIGATLVAKWPPDGHTLLVTLEVHVVNHFANARLPYDTVRDFAPVSLLARNPNVVAAPAAIKIASLREFVEWAKSGRNKLNYGSPGFGTVVYLLTEQFKRRVGIDITHIPYKGGAPITQALLANEIQFSLLSYPLLRAVIASGDVKALAVTSSKRIPELPDVPTMAEAGYPGFEAYSWYGVFARAGTPASLVARLNSEFAAALADPGVRAKLAPAGLEVVGSTPQEFEQFVRNELDHWSRFIGDNKIRFE